MESILRPAQNIQGKEITRLMQSFWGEGNPIATVSVPVESFASTQNILHDAQTMGNTSKGKAYVIENLVGKKISLGIRAGEKLIAHSGLTVKPWGEVECGGSVIAREYRDRSLMRDINESRRVLLRDFASLDFQLTSFLLLGSNSVHYGAHLFDFDDLNMGTYFCNIGPFVYNRPLAISQSDKGLLSDLSLKTETNAISSSAQIIGVRRDDPPKIAKSLVNLLPKSIKDFIEGFPVSEDDSAQTQHNVVNSTHYSPAKIAIHIRRNPYEDANQFTTDLTRDIDSGNNVIIQIPLQDGVENVVKQMANFTGKDYNGTMIVPTGLTIVDGYWGLTFASIRSNRLPDYKRILEGVLTRYDEESLKKLASYSLNALESSPNS